MAARRLARKSLGFFAGAASLRSALRLLRSHSELWVWCALPFLVNLAAFALALSVFWHYWDPLSQSAASLLPIADPSAWYGWIWVGPLRVIAWLLRWILMGLFGAALYFLFTLLGGVLASPFLDVLSRRVEQLHNGEVLEASQVGLRAALTGSLRVVIEEGRRTLFLLGGWLAFFLIGWVPGLQPIAFLGALLFAMFFAPLDYTGYLLDRRGIPFRERRRWLWQHKRATFGFGATALCTFVIPGVNFLCLPWLVSAGTLLALDMGAPASDSDLGSGH